MSKKISIKSESIWLLFLFFALVFSYVSVFSAESVSSIRVGLYQNQPKLFIKEDGTASGFWADIISYIATQEEWSVEFVAGSWEQCLNRLEKGEIDIMPDVAFTEKRRQVYLFSDVSVYTSWSGIYTQEGEAIQSILDLDDKKIAVLKNSVNYEGPEGLKSLVNAFNINCTFVEKDDYIEVFDSVEKGEVHAGVASKDFAIRHLSDFDLVTTPIIFQPSTLYFAFPNNTELSLYFKNRVDYHIRTIKNDENSIYYQSLEKWFSANPEDTTLFKWLLWGLTASAVVIFFFAVGSFLLRSQVQLRTKELTEEIAERKKVEEELQRHQRQLEEMVTERTAELTRSNKELELFAYITSHDLQEPLRMVTSYLQLIEKRYANKLDEDGNEFITFAVEGAKRMQTLINDLLKYSRVGTRKKEFTQVNCMKVLSDTLNNLEIAIEESKANITHDSLPIVKGDETQLRQLFQNLIGNAIKFRGEKPPQIHVGVKELEEKWQFSIHDNGIGIEEKYFERIFQVFQRLHGRKEFSGNGIGLAVCKKIVEKHGGEIDLQSTPGEGTTFIFTIIKGRKSA